MDSDNITNLNVLVSTPPGTSTDITQSSPINQSVQPICHVNTRNYYGVLAAADPDDDTESSDGEYEKNNDNPNRADPTVSTNFTEKLHEGIPH